MCIRDRLESVLNDDNMFEHNGERFYSHVREDGDRNIGEEPRARDGYRAIRFADETTVVVTQSERGQADGMSFDYDVDIAMAVALQSAVSLAASNYARKDPANWSQRRASEIDRLWSARAAHFNQQAGSRLVAAAAGRWGSRRRRSPGEIR